MKRIALRGIDGEGKYAIVDSELYDFLMQWKWCGNISGYAVSGKLSMHRLIIQAKPGTTVDHINRNRLDNRRKNLRICLGNENAENTKRRYKNSKPPKKQNLKPLVTTMS